MSGSHWILRYKLHHIPLWFAYHFLWWTMRIGSPVAVFHAIFYTPGATKFFFYLILQALAVYFNLYVLVPRLLEKRKYVLYTSIVVVTVVVTALLIVTGYYFGAWMAGRPFQEVYGIDPSNWYSLFEGSALPSTAASMTLAMSIKLASDWLRARRREALLEREKLDTELKFLRSQFNPHFLFNTINSIFVLINKNPAMASDALAKFSDLLRYQLYECNEDQIPLHQEVLYLENFIELERLRQSADHLRLTVEIDQPPHPDLMITPFVMIPFVENAFKHVSRSKDTDNFISITLKFDDRVLLFSVTNSIRPSTEISREVVARSGIGLKNVRRRLDLLYEEKYNLLVVQNEPEFQVKLRMSLQCRSEGRDHVGENSSATLVNEA